jgi:hypothetical protein
MLMSKVQNATATNRDLLREMAGDLRSRVESLQREYEEVLSRVNAG